MAIAGSTFNTRDPRFQEQLLKAGARPRHRQRGLVGRITGDFAGEQLRKDLQFAEIFDRHRNFEANLGLSKRKLAFDDKMFNKALRDEERGIYITTAAGLGTGVLNYMQGRRRAALQREDRLTEQENQRRLERIQLYGRPDLPYVPVE